MEVSKTNSQQIKRSSTIKLDVFLASLPWGTRHNFSTECRLKRVFVRRC